MREGVVDDDEEEEEEKRDPVPAPTESKFSLRGDAILVVVVVAVVVEDTPEEEDDETRDWMRRRDAVGLTIPSDTSMRVVDDEAAFAEEEDGEYPNLFAAPCNLCDAFGDEEEADEADVDDARGSEDGGVILVRTTT
jgi:hypothetical protein